MNYERIYSEFIRDRLTKQPKRPTYFERHHINPRSLGGGDGTENIIRLTPEDHFFAHLLLAKIHGGRLWSAVLLMSGRLTRRDAYRARPVYAMARRLFVEFERQKDGLKGADNGNHNPTVYEWRNLDTGDERLSTLHEMWSEFGGARATYTSVVSGDKNSIFGWALKSASPKRGFKGKRFQFVNRDGRTFEGTQGEFARHVGSSPATASRVCRHADVTADGWRLAGVKDRNHLFSKRTGKPAKLGSGRTYRATKSGVVLTGKRAEIARQLGSTAAQFSAGHTQILNGRTRAYKGWQIEVIR